MATYGINPYVVESPFQSDGLLDNLHQHYMDKKHRRDVYIEKHNQNTIQAAAQKKIEHQDRREHIYTYKYTHICVKVYTYQHIHTYIYTIYVGVFQQILCS